MLKHKSIGYKISIMMLALTLLAVSLGCAGMTTFIPTNSANSVLQPTLPTGLNPLPGVNSGSSGDLAVSNKPRQASPQTPDADLKTLSGDNNAFALDLYHALPDKTPQNLVFAPYSISQALAMTFAGANGKTASQMAQVLHFTLTPQRLHPAFNALDLSLQKTASSDNPDQFQLKIANSLWGQTGYPFLSDFLDLLAENYGAGMHLTDYSNAPEPSRLAINQWVSEQTNNKIKDLLAQGVITPDTRLTLVNAIYFNAHWVYPFEHNETHLADFTHLDGSKTQVPFMSPANKLDLQYTRGTNYQAVELPYKGDEVAMTLIVPNEGHFYDVQSSISAAWLNDCWAQMKSQQVNLGMPKFKFETSLGLSEVLGGMGMQDAVNRSAADFSGMDGRHDLYIGAVVHKALIALDEDGTEAAAATAVIMKPEAALPRANVVPLIIDRPFFFIIHDTHNQSILFMGQVVDPH